MLFDMQLRLWEPLNYMQAITGVKDAKYGGFEQNEGGETSMKMTEEVILNLEKYMKTKLDFCC